MNRRRKTALVAAAGMLAWAAAAAPAEAALTAGTAAVVGTGWTQGTPGTTTPEGVDRFVNFEATGVFTIPTDVAVEVAMDCSLDATGSETHISGTGMGLLLCLGSDGASLLVNRSLGRFVRVGPELVYTSEYGSLWVKDTTTNTVTVALTLTLVPTSPPSLSEFAAVGNLTVADTP